MFYCQIVFLLFLLPLPIHLQLISNKNDVYSPQETASLKALYQEVNGDLYLDYHSSNRFLINWLRHKKLDVPQAAESLRKSLKYKRENKIDNIFFEEEMLKFHKSYPATFGKAVDRLGNPAYQLSFSTWDIRKAMLQGKREKLFRYVFFVFESSMRAARSLNATNFIFFPDMSNYNLRKHACLACIPYYVHLVSTYERHYPNTARYIIAINTPRIFEAVSNVMLPLMNEETQKVYKIFGPNKDEWQRFVLQVFSPEQLTRQYGGTRLA